MTELDLTQFCADPDYSFRRDLMQPFTQGEHTFATDGHILVRVPKRHGVASGGPDVCRIKEIATIEDGPFCTITIDERNVVPEVPAKSCSHCRGSGKVVVCDDCGGTGYVSCCECGGEKDCPRCDGGATPFTEDASIPAGQDVVECDDCDGDGVFVEAVPEYTQVKIGTRWFKSRYVDLVASLPNAAVRISTDDPRTPMPFRFDGGFGLLMPMTGRVESEERIQQTDDRTNTGPDATVA